jgi:hypothetical protein
VFIRPPNGTPNPDSTHGVYISNTLSQKTIFSNADFLPLSLSNIPLGSSTQALLNKRTHHTCGQPQGIRAGFVLRVDLESNLDLVSKASLNGGFMHIKYSATSAKFHFLHETLRREKERVSPW